MNRKTLPKDLSQKNPVTSIIRRRIKDGYEAEFDRWSERIAEACSKFPGHLGIQRIKPTDPRGEHVTIISFDSYENYHAWEESDERSQLMDQVKPLTEGMASSEHIEGLNYWLIPNNGKGKSWPPDFRMVLVALIAIWPTIHFLRPLLMPYLPEHPLLASLVPSAVFCFVMSYVTLPVAVRLFRRWLP